ncbi:IKBKB [Bugula neritina]|uniref:IKBKB n=1 Tax=Bugula neritina TaxID=10212 RepID=A0A7J7KAE0_BUGNE|nr:IKBKB [Bugula neritina]
MTEMQQDEGEWIKEMKLGQGGFGQVYLFKNTRSGEQIAVKKCGANNELSTRMREKWDAEVEIMSRINHDNIVRALPTPAQFIPQANEPPALIMEYCSGGDLRNLGKDYGRRCSLQIIDLGYAKELFDSSILYSFVGTMQYLAPELMSKKGYTRTVDFWSFGVVLFECITGVRPFLPSEVPFRWFAEVQKKKPDDICVYYNIDGEITNSDKLVFPNHLCRTSRAFFEQFLKVMLSGTPESRGGRAESGSVDRDRCWKLLDNILSSPLLFIYCVPLNKLLTYPVEDKHTIKDVLKALERETSIPMTELELLTVQGTFLSLNQRARDMAGQDEQPSLYVFRKFKGDNQDEVLPPLPSDGKLFPELVQFMIQREDIALNSEDQVKFMSQGAYYCGEKAKEFLRIYLSSKAIWYSLMRELSDFVKNRNVVRAELFNLHILIDFCDQGFQTDLAQYESQSQDSTGGARFESVNTIKSWNDMRAELKAMKSLEEELNQLSTLYDQLQMSIEELKKKPFSVYQQYPGAGIHQLFEKSHQLYIDIRKRSRGETARPTNQDMLSCISQITALSERQTNGLHAYCRVMMEKRLKIASLAEQLSSIMTRIGEFGSRSRPSSRRDRRHVEVH